MAIMRPTKPAAAPAVEPVKHAPAGFEGVTVDSKYNPTATITTFLEGQAWAVDYYSQVIDKTDGLSALDGDVPAVYQQYRLIRGFELKVSSPLSVSQDGDSKEMSLTGAANVYSVLIPNEGDMFIADVGDGREGLFSITSTSRLSIYKETAHTIEYKMVSYNTETFRTDLNKKSIETLYFDREYLRTGNNPILNQQTVDIRQKLTAHYNRLIAVYFNDFYSRELSTLILPDQHYITYDPFIVKFIFSILSTNDHPYIRYIQQLNVSEDALMYELTLWHCLETMDHRLLAMAAAKMSLIDVKSFYSRPMFNSIYYTKVRRVVYPDQRSNSVDARYKSVHMPTRYKVEEGGTRFSDLDVAVPTVPSDPLLIKPVTVDDHYVLSQSFYHDQEGNSQLEQLIECALKGKPIDLTILDQLCEDSLDWPNLERFYYIPLLITLLKVYPRTL